MTPAQQHGHSLVRRLGVVAQSGGTVRAVATLQDGGGPTYPLLLYLERRGSDRD